MTERTLCILKPDLVANQEGVARVLHNIVYAGLVIVGLRVLNPMSFAEAEALYAEHKEKHFYDATVKFMVSDVSIALVLQGEHVITWLRSMAGATDPKKAALGTIRNRFGTELPRNAIHGAASVEDAKREIQIFFGRK